MLAAWAIDAGGLLTTLLAPMVAFLLGFDLDHDLQALYAGAALAAFVASGLFIAKMPIESYDTKSFVGLGYPALVGVGLNVALGVAAYCIARL